MLDSQHPLCLDRSEPTDEAAPSSSRPSNKQSARERQPISWHAWAKDAKPDDTAQQDSKRPRRSRERSPAQHQRGATERHGSMRPIMPRASDDRLTSNSLCRVWAGVVCANHRPLHYQLHRFSVSFYMVQCIFVLPIHRFHAEQAEFQELGECLHLVNNHIAGVLCKICFQTALVLQHISECQHSTQPFSCRASKRPNVNCPMTVCLHPRYADHSF